MEDRTNLVEDTSDQELSPLRKTRARVVADGYNALHQNGNGPIFWEKMDDLHQREERDGSRKKVRQMTFFLGVAVVLIIVMAALLIWQHFITTKTPCVSPTCVETAGFIVSKMDVTVDPCQDFYSYACGGWMNKTYPPPDKAKWSTFAATYEKNSKILKRLLEVNGSVYMGKNSTAIAKTKKYFHVCMNKSAVEDKGNTPLLELIKAVGSWTLTSDPVSGQWDKSNWKPLDTLVKVHKLNHASLFGMGITTDDKNTSANIIQFQQSGLTLSSRESYLKNGTEKFHQAFLQYGTEYTRLLGADNSSAEKMEAVYQFEKQLAEIFVRAEDMIDPIKTYNKMTVGEFKQIFGESIPLDEYLQRMFGESVPETESVIVSTPSYFKKLNKLLQQTKPETLVDYLVWNLVQVLPGYLPSTFSNAALKLDSVETGITELSPQWSRCVSKADSSFGFASGALFVEDPARFPPDTRTVISDMLGKVRDTFVEELPNIAWMEPSVRQIAIDKALAVEKYVGYPDWIRNPAELDKYYQKVEVTDGFFESMVNLRRFFRNKNLEKRGKVPDTKIWSQTPTTVNAYYSPSHNYFAFPAGILQRPFYDPTFPMSFNYGSIGFVMGHELTHGFDNTGRHHDKHGNLYNWWTKQSIKAFKERSQCMVDQYSQYEVQGEHIKGERTLAENIADNGGLKTAYLTYQKYSSQRTEPEKQLPGLPPNSDKLFFIGFAQVWCSYYTPAYAQTAILTDPHSPAKYRVIGVLSNSEEFSEVFGCRKNVDTLNPENKCQVW